MTDDLNYNLSKTFHTLIEDILGDGNLESLPKLQSSITKLSLKYLEDKFSQDLNSQVLAYVTTSNDPLSNLYPQRGVINLKNPGVEGVDNNYVIVFDHNLGKKEDIDLKNDNIVIITDSISEKNPTLADLGYTYDPNLNIIKNTDTNIILQFFPYYYNILQQQLISANRQAKLKKELDGIKKARTVHKYEARLKKELDDIKQAQAKEKQLLQEKKAVKLIQPWIIDLEDNFLPYEYYIYKLVLTQIPNLEYII